MAPSVTRQVLIPKDRIETAFSIIGYLSQQTKIMGFRPNPKGKDMALWFSSESFRDPKVADTFYRTMRERYPDIFQGYSSGEYEGSPALIVYQEVNAKGNAEKKKEILDNKIKEVVDLIESDITDYAKTLDNKIDYETQIVDMYAVENDWKENKNGESYLQRINETLGQEVQDRISGQYREEYKSILDQEIKQKQKAPKAKQKVSYQLNKPKKVKVKKDKKKGIGKPGVSYQLRDAEDKYGISHRPSKEGPPAHDLFEGAKVPNDVYDTPRYYIGSLPKDKVYKETVDAIRYLKSIKGNPEAEVTVYRAGPKKELNNGDWITLSKTYAKGHADSWNTFEGENYKLHEFKVKAKDVLWDMNSLEEWGYYPKEKEKVSYQLTPAQKEFFKDTKVVDSKGNPKVVYHGTSVDFDEFEKGEFGFHFGTAEQANQRIDNIEGGNVMPVYLNITNPIEMQDDLGTWDVKNEWIKYLDNWERDGLLVDMAKKLPQFQTELDLFYYIKDIKSGNNFTQELTNLFKQAGYDGIVYPNRIEGPGTSYIAFNANQIKSATAMAEQPTKDPRISYQLKPTGKPLDIYDEITGKESFGRRPKGPRKLIKAYESGIIPISTLLKRIDPKIYSFLLKHQYSVAIRTNQAKEDIILLDKMIKRMSKKDQVAFKLAMLNSDGTTLRDLAQKYDKKEDFTKALSNVRQVLDELRDQLIEVGEEVGFIEEYYPRKVTDYDGLITELYGDSEVKALIEKQIAEKEKNEERKLSPSEKADLINKLIRGYSYIKSRPSFIKTRKLDTITLKMADFYEDPIIQLNNHMERVVERIENKRFFGAGETSDESLGDFIQKIIDSGISLTDAQQKDLMRIFGAYFNFEPTNSTLGAIKTGTYGILLGRFTNTITQMQDMVYGIYENKWNQIRTIKNLVNYFKGKIVETERVKRADVGADMIGQEFKIETKSGFEKFMNGSTNIILTGSGFKLMDGLGKSVLINSAIQKYKTKAKKNRLSKKDKDYLKTLFGNSYDQVIEELKEDTSPSEYTENELFIGYATLLKYQPIGRTEVPLKYLESKGGRILYMLRTFSIKQLNVLRDESMDILTGKQVGNKKMALFNLFYLVGLMTMAGAGGDEIKDWIKGKSSSIWDNVQDNLLKIILINKYWTSKVQREAAYKGYIKSTFDNVRNLLISVPPIDVTIDFIQGVTEFIFKEENDKKKSKLTRYIPWIGDVVYSRREWSEFTGVGGRGKDDYTYRELNSLYKKSYTEQKELDKRELRVYTQSLLDALNYPQTKLRKGKEVRKINIEKHYNHLNGKYNIQIGKNSKGKYEKLN